jgi:hypothetical protein
MGAKWQTTDELSEFMPLERQKYTMSIRRQQARDHEEKLRMGD